MHIFVDESGTFASSTREGSFSSMTAFVIPESHLRLATEILRRFKTENGFADDDEVKRRHVREDAYFVCSKSYEIRSTALRLLWSLVVTSPLVPSVPITCSFAS